MATPRFIAKKIGDQYVLQRKDVAGTGEDFLFASIGGVLTLAGLARGGALGYLAAFGGASLICRGVTGKNPFAGLAAQTQLQRVPGPTHQNDARPTEQKPEDHVEEASMESFPGSDPPARTAAARA